MRAPRDTAPAVWSRVLDEYRRLAPEERVRLALEMSDEVAAIARAGIRHRHPDWSDARIQDDLQRQLRGPESAATRARCHVIPVDPACLGRAAEIGCRYEVRTPDALHLAAADRLPQPLVVLTFDRRLADAAGLMELAVEGA